TAVFRWPPLQGKRPRGRSWIWAICSRRPATPRGESCCSGCHGDRPGRRGRGRERRWCRPEGGVRRRRRRWQWRGSAGPAGGGGYSGRSGGCGCVGWRRCTAARCGGCARTTPRRSRTSSRARRSSARCARRPPPTAHSAPLSRRWSPPGTEHRRPRAPVHVLICIVVCSRVRRVQQERHVYRRVYLTVRDKSKCSFFCLRLHFFFTFGFPLLLH
ncbi:hypothetical protein ABZP36_022287, partial [Zizania latifolia]